MPTHAIDAAQAARRTWNRVPAVLVLRAGGPFGHASPHRFLEGTTSAPPAHWLAGASAAAFDAALGRAGVPASCRGGAMVSQVHPGNAAFAFPGDVAWSDFPVTGGPRFRARFSDPKMFGLVEEGRARVLGADDLPCGSAGLAAALERAPLVVLDCAAEDLPGLAGAAWRLLPAVGRAPGLRIAWFDGQGMRDARPALGEAERRERPDLRFRWTWHLNATALVGRAAETAVARHPSADMDWMGDRAAARAIARGIADPWFPQVLQALRRAGLPAVPVHVDSLLTTAGAPGYRVDGGRHLIEWAGTGRYAPIRWELAGERPENDVGTPVAWAMHQLARCGLATVDAAGAGRLTPRGAALLDLLPPEMDDPDLMLRWRTPEGLLCGDGDVQATDRWLARAFRALKRRVSALPDPEGGKRDPQDGPGRR